MAQAFCARRLLRTALFLMLIVAFEDVAMAETPDLIEAGASQNHFYIEPSYDGTSIALFGSVDSDQLKNQPFEVAVTLRGPIKPVTVWKKARRAGLWVNSQSITFDGVPNYYAVLSTKPLEEIASLEARKDHEIGVDALQFSDAGRQAAWPAVQGLPERADHLERDERPFRRAQPGRHHFPGRETFPRKHLSSRGSRSRAFTGPISMSSRKAASWVRRARISD